MRNSYEESQLSQKKSIKAVLLFVSCLEKPMRHAISFGKFNLYTILEITGTDVAPMSKFKILFDVNVKKYTLIPSVESGTSSGQDA